MGPTSRNALDEDDKAILFRKIAFQALFVNSYLKV
jgi:hypothetical protein